MLKMTTDLRQYVDERCVPVPESGCWLWLLSNGSHGYGQGYWQGQVTTAPRLAYQAYRGAIPRGKLVQHSCDNKWCVNPDHLSLGTDKTNAVDKARKGRALRKHTVNQLVSCKAAVVAGAGPAAAARQTGVSQTTAKDISRGKVAAWVL